MGAFSGRSFICSLLGNIFSFSASSSSFLNIFLIEEKLSEASKITKMLIMMSAPKITEVA